MREKYKVFMVIAIIIIDFIVIYYNLIGKYLFEFKINWSITIPKGDTIIFEKKPEPSFHGDGQTYLVLEYNNRKLQKLKESIEWNKSKNIELEKEIIELLGYMDVPKHNYPNFDEEYLYYYDKRDDLSRLYLILINKNMYLIEDCR